MRAGFESNALSFTVVPEGGICPARRVFRLYCAYMKKHSLLSGLLEGLQNRCIEKNDVLVSKLRKFDLEIIGV